MTMRHDDGNRGRTGRRELAHRGASAYAPEHSFFAYDLEAARRRFEALTRATELDVSWRSEVAAPSRTATPAGASPVAGVEVVASGPAIGCSDVIGAGAGK